MFAAAAHDDLRGFVGQAVLAFEFVGNRLAQFGNAAARGVFGEPFVERLDRGVFDVLRRVEIRLARAETDDVLALGLHLLGLGVDGQSQRRGERGGALGDSVVHKSRKPIAGRAGGRKGELRWRLVPNSAGYWASRNIGSVAGRTSAWTRRKCAQQQSRCSCWPNNLQSSEPTSSAIPPCARPPFPLLVCGFYELQNLPTRRLALPVADFGHRRQGQANEGRGPGRR